jgi:hypothetical protein
MMGQSLLNQQEPPLPTSTITCAKFKHQDSIFGEKSVGTGTTRNVQLAC